MLFLADCVFSTLLTPVKSAHMLHIGDDGAYMLRHAMKENFSFVKILFEKFLHTYKSFEDFVMVGEGEDLFAPLL